MIWLKKSHESKVNRLRDVAVTAGALRLENGSTLIQTELPAANEGAECSHCVCVASLRVLGLLHHPETRVTVTVSLSLALRWTDD